MNQTSVKNRKEKALPTKGKSSYWTALIFASFFAALAVYLCMLYMEKQILKPYEKGIVIAVKRDIPEGFLFTEQTLDTYLEKKEVDLQLIPTEALTDMTQLSGNIARVSLAKGVLLTPQFLENTNMRIADMKQPVVAGITVEDLSQIVGGVLRAGDRIQIYNRLEEDGEWIIWPDVYVQQVFDSSGGLIENEDRTSAAQRINVFLEKKDVEAFYDRMKQGEVRIVKIWDNRKGEYSEEKNAFGNRDVADFDSLQGAEESGMDY